MLCKHCGTEIADKALICFRCGAATAEPASAPQRRGRGGRRGVRLKADATLAFLILLVAGLTLGQAAAGTAPRALGWVLLATAALVLVWRLLLRR